MGLYLLHSRKNKAPDESSFQSGETLNHKFKGYAVSFDFLNSKLQKEKQFEWVY